MAEPSTHRVTKRPDVTAGLMEIRHTGRTSRAYDAIYSGEGIRQPKRFHRWLLRLIDARPGMRLLDVACGEAQLSRAAGDWGLEAHGVDFSVVALRRGERDSQRTMLGVADGESLPYAEGTFDRVTSIGSLEHYEDPIRGAAELGRVLRDDGLAAVLLPNSFGLRWNVLYTWRSGDIHDDGQPLQRYGTRRQWVRVLEAGGLRVIRTHGHEGFLEGPVAWLGALRHPSRLLMLVGDRLPIDMASMFVFVCRKKLAR